MDVDLHIYLDFQITSTKIVKHLVFHWSSLCVNKIINNNKSNSKTNGKQQSMHRQATATATIRIGKPHHLPHTTQNNMYGWCMAGVCGMFLFHKMILCLTGKPFAICAYGIFQLLARKFHKPGAPE